MRIDEITFHNFKSRDRFASVNFSDDNVTIIFGDNGCGKTTFLKAISAFLSQDESSLKALGVNRIECKISDGGNVRDVIVSMDDGVFNWEEFENSFLQNSRSLSLGVERGVSTQAVNIDPELFYDFFMNFNKNNDFFNEARSVGFQRKKIFELSEELSFFIRRRNAVKYRNRRPEIDFGKHHLYLQNIKIENIEELLLQRYRIARFTATRKIQSALFDTLSVAIDIENSNPSTKVSNSEVLGQRILENKDRIIEALDDGEDNNFKNRIVNILNKINQKGELDKILGHSLLSQLFENMIDELEVEKLVLSSINLLVDKFNGYLIDGKKLFVNGREVYVEIDGEHHTVNELSSGERHILTFLALVLFEGQDRNFLIIDEPEISLNIKWQRELMSIFSALLPTTQIIVASHSPALAKRNPNFLSELKVWRS
ncbi:AAA family ATPase [Shewanella sp. LC6]|uniref:AAA family ATPase n=2 Tax=Shewanella TaxID=22 RepID=UPI00002F91E6|nr:MULTISPECIES: AAA family ATPase [Shewanella]ASF15532.1 hypothetical protein CEQ32_11485 [Shewanella sp. FDAARGOS_354]MDH1624613.1 ATP-binding protein [Shewanella xiamenensis]QQK61277.1 AAA family ATPase [Shewanella sp. LC6]TPE62349.1 ATP-binding cassette domain-containing protein [Shewanella sp. LC2]